MGNLLAAFEVGEAALVNFGDAGERADVIAIALGGFLQILDFTGEQLQVHGEGFVALDQPLQPLSMLMASV